MPKRRHSAAAVSPLRAQIGTHATAAQVSTVTVGAARDIHNVPCASSSAGTSADRSAATVTRGAARTLAELSRVAGGEPLRGDVAAHVSKVGSFHDVENPADQRRRTVDLLRDQAQQ